MTADATSAPARVQCDGPDTTVVAPFLLARVGGVPATVLDGLLLTGTVDLLAAADRAVTRQRELAGPLTDALHGLVPRLDDRRLRRAALALKRAAHNDRPPPLSDPDTTALAGLLPAGCLDAWLRVVDEARAARERAEAAAVTATTAANAALAAGSAAPAVAHGLELAGPDLRRELTRPGLPGRLAPGSRLSRSLLGYLARAAVKTSPFSTFTGLGYTTFGGPDRHHPYPPTGARRVVEARAFATDLLLTLAATPAYGPALRYRVADGVAGTAVLHSRPTCADGFFWRHEQVVRADAYTGLLDRLAPLRGGPVGYADLVTALGGTAAVGHAVDLGLVAPVAPWSAGDDDCRPRLAATVRALDTPAAVRVADAIAHTAPGAATPDPTGAHAAAGRVPPHWLRRAPRRHEDAGTDVAVPLLGARVHDDLRRPGELIRPQLFRGHLYDHLVAHFTGRYGAGGHGGDLRDFLYSFLLRPDAATILATSVRRDHARRPLLGAGQPGAGRPAGAAHGGPPPAAAVVFQLAGDRIVVNQIVKGVGGMVARYLPLLDARTGLADDLRGWVGAHCAGATPLEVPVASDWSGLQRPTGLLRRLRWPGEVPTADDAEAVALDDLTVVHHPATGTLSIQDRDGRPVAPVYLGTAPPYLATGPLRLLLTLADPWVLPATTATGPGDRVTAGRLVLHRQRWQVAAAEFPRPAPGESVAATLARADAWRRHAGLPAEVFVTVGRRQVSLAAARRKPVWCAFASPHALAQVAALLDTDAVSVTLTEALPGRADTHLPDARTAEYVALLRWPGTIR